ncbi:MAG: energy transducer TonB [Pyrinomonadaceae bacterium]
MFDKLIVSDEQGAEFKGRSRYFMISTVVVGILFISAVVFSLYAADIGLGNDQFELSMMIAPITPEAPQPPKPIEAQNQPQSNRSDMPIRNDDILRIEENPKIPTGISVTPSTSLSRIYERYLKRDGPETSGSSIQSDGRRSVGEVGTSSADTSETAASVDKIPDPPPVMKPKPPTMVSKGVINGQAKFLPHPPYPKPAQMVGAQGAVSVQITIDETGKVISSKAINGHPLLRSAAEKAAWSAKFSPTFLSEVPVKVTGVIVYNFKRS